MKFAEPGKTDTARKGKKGQERIDIEEFVALQQELVDTREKYGIKKKEGIISRAISWYFDRKEKQVKIPVSRKKYLLLAVFTGWMGGHRFYAKHYVTAVFYLLLFWTGFPLAMTLVDLMIALPMKPDENGMIMM